MYRNKERTQKRADQNLVYINLCIKVKKREINKRIVERKEANILISN